MRPLLAEYLGTFFLALTALASGNNSLAVALTLTAVIYALGYLSGGHFNPAVSLAAWIRGNMERADMTRHIAAQFAGAGSAWVGWLALTAGDGFSSFSAGGVPAEIARMMQAAGVQTGMRPSVFPALAAEFLFTLLPVFVWLHVGTTRRQNANQYFGAAAGAAHFAGLTCATRFSGGALNPAVGLALALSGAVPFWMILIYLISAAAAGAAAAVLFRILNPND